MARADAGADRSCTRLGWRFTGLHKQVVSKSAGRRGQLWQIVHPQDWDGYGLDGWRFTGLTNMVSHGAQAFERRLNGHSTAGESAHFQCESVQSEASARQLPMLRRAPCNDTRGPQSRACMANNEPIQGSLIAVSAMRFVICKGVCADS